MSLFFDDTPLSGSGGGAGDRLSSVSTNSTISGNGTSGSPLGTTATLIGLGDVDNTPDASKPVSTATTAAISSATSASAVKTAYESNADTNAYTDAEKTKLAGLSGGGGGGSGGGGSGKIGDYVWRDADRDGIQDRSESGWAGVSVSLRRCNGPVVKSTRTNGAGRYQFTGVAPGRYQVVVARPSGSSSFSRSGAGNNDGLNSDVDPKTGRTWCTTISSAGENRRSLDAGVIPRGGSGGAGGNKSSIGDMVWRDKNRNGIRQNSERGVAGVRVQLQRCNGKNLRTTRTNSAGKYVFSNLQAGRYRIKFGKPAGKRFSPLRRGKDRSRDSDAKPANGTTACVTLRNNDKRTGIDAGILF